MEYQNGFARELLRYFYGAAENELPLLQKFARAKGVTVETLVSWSREHPEFAAAMEEARVHLVGLLIERATVKSCDPTFAKFLLSEQEVLWPVPSTAERVLEVDIRVTE
ncbi:MAG: hypothetical protein J6R40_04465 [Clostridia bacterium]|nr:hypothetical protein [Clostridia bacterium]